MAGLAPSSAAFGPSSSACIAAAPTACVFGTSRSTGTSPALSVKLPRKKYARTVVVPAGTGDALAGGAGDPMGPALPVGDGEPPGVGSLLGTSSDGCSVGGGVATPPRSPVSGPHATAAKSARTKAAARVGVEAGPRK